MKVDIYKVRENVPSAVLEIALMWSSHNGKFPTFTKDGRYFLGTITLKELEDNYTRIQKGAII